MKIPSNYTLVFTKEQIAKRTKELGQEISQYLANFSDSVIAVPVMRGAMFFYSDLVRLIDRSLLLVPAYVSTYELGANNVQKKEGTISMDPTHIKGRAVLIIDDIAETGNTLKLMTDYCLQHGATKVISVTLIQRLIANPLAVPTWHAFVYEKDNWFVGYGMEDREEYRNLADVYIMN